MVRSPALRAVDSPFGAAAHVPPKDVGGVTVPAWSVLLRVSAKDAVPKLSDTRVVSVPSFYALACL